MDISVEKLKELLVKPGHISESDFAGAEEQAKKEEKNLPEVLIAKDLIKDEQIGLLIAEENGYRFINLLVEKPAEDVFNLIPELVARAKGLVAINRGKDGISVGMINPEDLEIRHALEKKLGEKIIPLYITKRGLESALLRYRSSLKVEFNKTLNRLQTGALSKEERDEIMVGMIDTILQYGYDNKASDIHIEPYRKK